MCQITIRLACTDSNLVRTLIPSGKALFLLLALRFNYCSFLGMKSLLSYVDWSGDFGRALVSLRLGHSSVKSLTSSRFFISGISLIRNLYYIQRIQSMLPLPRRET